MQKLSEKDFDLKIKSMLDEAREEVPEHVWSAVSERISSPKAAPAVWWKWALGAACAAAAASVLVLNGTFSKDTQAVPSIASPVIAEQVSGPVAEPVSQPEEEPVIEIVSAPAPRKAVKIAQAGPVIESAVEETAMAETATAETAAPEPAAEPEPAVDPETAAGHETAEKKAAPAPVVTDPFSQMAFEDAHRRIAAFRPSSLDIRGKVGTNDGLGAGTPIGVGPHAASGTAAKTLATNVAESSESIYSIPVTFGIGLKFPLAERFYLGTGVEYSVLSRKFDGIYTQVGDNQKIEKTVKGDIAHNVSYIGIPVNAYYSLLSSDLLDFYVFGGGEVEKCIANKYRISESGNDIIFKDATKGVQMSVGLGMGVSINISDFLSVYADPSARYYFDCAQPKTIRKQQPLMFGLDLGLRFNL